MVPKGGLGALAEAKETNKNVLLRVLVGEEGLPAAIGGVVPSNQLDLVGKNLWTRPISNAGGISIQQ